MAKHGFVFSVVFAFGIVLTVLAAQAQQEPSKQIPCVGFLHTRGPGSSAEEAFRQGLHDLGYRVGQDMILEFRYAHGDPARFPDFAAELVRLGVDLLVAPTPQAVAAARRATTTTPIVFVVVGDPVGTGVVASLSRPGGNITGVSGFSSELGGKRLELLKELLPRLMRVAVLWNPSVPDKVIEWQQTQEAARALGLQLQSLEVRARGDFAVAFEAARRGGAEAMIALPEPLVFNQRDVILEFTATSHLPALYAWKEFVEAGGLISYGPNIDANYRRAAVYVDKIHKGARPADLPVERPTKFELVINLKTAQALGITIPPSLLVFADQVIK
jgi:putative ABC transport system substrate-binding protein